MERALRDVGTADRLQRESTHRELSHSSSCVSLVWAFPPLFRITVKALTIWVSRRAG